MTGVRRARLAALRTSAGLAAHAANTPAAIAAARAPLAAWPGPGAPVSVGAGKTVFVAPCSSRGPGCGRAA